MPRTLTASDRRSLIRLASAMPVGSPERKAILKGLKKTGRAGARFAEIRSLKDVRYAVMDVMEDAVIAGLDPDDINREISSLV